MPDLAIRGSDLDLAANNLCDADHIKRCLTGAQNDRFNGLELQQLSNLRYAKSLVTQSDI